VALTVTTTLHANEAYVDVTIAGATNNATVSVERLDSEDTASTIRAGAALTLTGTSGVIPDHEVPFDVPIRYRVTNTVISSETATSAALTVPSYDKTWLKDPATSSRNMVLHEVQDIETMTREAQAGVFPILDRRHPVVVAARRHGVKGDLRCTTATLAERTDLVDLLSRGQVLLLATPGAYGLGNIYVHVGDVSETMIGPVTTQSRRWTLPMIQVDRPAQLAIAPARMTWGVVKFSWSSWDALYAENVTWDELLFMAAP